MHRGHIASMGEHDPSFAPHRATDAAIEHSAHQLELVVDADWLSTEASDDRLFESYTGIWVAPGSPYKNLYKTLRAIQRAREQDVPCLGTCSGFQHTVLEYARNALGFHDAQHAEYDPYALELFISQLECSLAGHEMQLNFVADSRIAEIYGSTFAREEYYCDFGANPRHVQLLRAELSASSAPPPEVK